MKLYLQNLGKGKDKYSNVQDHVQNIHWAEYPLFRMSIVHLFTIVCKCRILTRRDRPTPLSATFQRKDWQIEENSQDRHGEPTDRTGSQRKPKCLFVRT